MQQTGRIQVCGAHPFEANRVKMPRKGHILLILARVLT